LLWWGTTERGWRTPRRPLTEYFFTIGRRTFPDVKLPRNAKRQTVEAQVRTDGHHAHVLGLAALRPASLMVITGAVIMEARRLRGPFR